MVFQILLFIVFTNAFEMWQLTDIHLDPMYTVGSDPLKLCREGKGNAGKYGDYSCDANMALLNSLVKFIKRNTDINGKVMVYNGDIVSRAIPKYNLDYVKQSIVNATALLKKFEGFFIIPMLGNHDVYPANQMAINSQWIFQFAADQFAPFLSQNAIESFRHGGYYTMPFPAHLGIKVPLNAVVLNTVLYYNYNKQTMDSTDPLGQFEWFKTVMDGYRKTGQRAIVSMHICPGVAERFNYSDQLYPQYNDRLVDSLAEYNDVILGVLCGHLHTDTFRILSKGNKKVMAFIGPSVDTWLGTSPSIRKYDVGNGLGYMKEFKNYHFQLRPKKDKLKPKTTIKQPSDGFNKWKFNYGSSSEYGLKELSPKEFEILAARMDKDLQLFNKYHLHFRADTPGFTCKGNCKNNCMCAVRYPRQNEFANCVVWN
ncbi:sphingomyelin phosphodiesterase, putative [Entamoeba dispar SAW760]|uniref:Sphingomyelin phosphodiesterase, putative n=1 Tax=Entamoeba dispar (strain ATCC PRA-260 / SAW760) TaxID=370354 RepID=B0ET38_ENTDS|nr:sphingomyelin phosphodiesterase, putative [Entamoeba dispar SAW760]EDR22291.1 sphingomyelin phosphodiesterase, putative [Entamoeba dispar SAW760]|eukprot:EDR22291.1 sphingomyelin phosphodiesterase, putative [Entamoeba dispar SAW760]